MKKRLKLNELKVQSFITDVETSKIYGASNGGAAGPCTIACTVKVTVQNNVEPLTIVDNYNSAPNNCKTNEWMVCIAASANIKCYYNPG